MRCTEFIAPHEASLLDCGPLYKTSHRYCRPAFDILKHPIQGFAFDRVQDLRVIASNKLTIAVYGCGVRFVIGGLQKNFKKLWRRGVIMLSVTDKLFRILLQKPVEIGDPIPPPGLDDHAKSRID